MQPQIVGAIKLAHMVAVSDVGRDLGLTDPGQPTGMEERAMSLKGREIALARALYGNPRLLLLDEPNSNLDSKGEAALADCIRQLKAEGVTLVAITHRLPLVSAVDKVMVLMNGVIEEKANRVVEVIVSSVRPWELFAGKLLGIGAVGLIQFLQSGVEGSNNGRRKLANEANRIGEQRLFVPRELNLARGGIERGEELICRIDVRLRDPIQ